MNGQHSCGYVLSMRVKQPYLYYRGTPLIRAPEMRTPSVTIPNCTSTYTIVQLCEGAAYVHVAVGLNAAVFVPIHVQGNPFN